MSSKHNNQIPPPQARMPFPYGPTLTLQPLWAFWQGRLSHVKTKSVHLQVEATRVLNLVQFGRQISFKFPIRLQRTPQRYTQTTILTCHTEGIRILGAMASGCNNGRRHPSPPRSQPDSNFEDPSRIPVLATSRTRFGPRRQRHGRGPPRATLGCLETGQPRSNRIANVNSQA